MIKRNSLCNVISIYDVVFKDVLDTHETIWVDEFSFCKISGIKKEHIVNELYRKFGNSDIEQTFIFMG